MTPRSVFLVSYLPALMWGLFGFTMVCAQQAAAQSKYTEEAFIKAFPKPSEELIESAEKLYQARCAHCHGRLADGTGVLRKNMRPRPRNLRVRGWFERVEYAKRTELLKQVIVGGGPALGLSPLMPPQPDLEERPELLYALIYHLAAYHKPPPIQVTSQKKGKEEDDTPDQDQEAQAEQHKGRKGRRGRKARKARRGRKGHQKRQNRRGHEERRGSRRRGDPLGPPSSL